MLLRYLQRMVRSRLFLVGIVPVLFVITVATFAPVFAPYSPSAQDGAQLLAPPGARHLLGTDQYGRDVLSQTIWGARISLEIGFAGLLVCSVLGCGIGLIAGSTGGTVDVLLTRVIDVLMSFPAIILAITVVGVISPGAGAVIVALGIAFSPRFARIIRGEVLAVRAREYVDAARALGASPARVMLRHILKNAIDPVIVLASLYLPYIIIVEASLDFLGIGVSPDIPTWGVVIANGKGYVTTAPWISMSPGVALILISVGINLLGDGLRDALDLRVQLD